jgi:succinylarginine dihydrolase
VTLNTGSMALIAPIESQENKNANQVLLKIQAEKNPISEVHFVDCRQSMLNGGGPACLRIRIVLTEAEQKACTGKVFLDEALYQRLVQWVERYYRDRLSIGDLVDPVLLNEVYGALDELTQILQLGTLYNFQKI